MPLLLFFSFLAGLVTIMAPCIWPILPIVLSASSGGGKQRSLGVTLGIMTSFTVFTLFISYLEKSFSINPNVFRMLAVIAIILLGLSMLVPFLGVKFEEFINRLLAPLQGKIRKKGSGFSAGYVMGFSTGMVWAPCSGPILATIATLAATQSVNIEVVLVTVVYVLGLGIPLFFFSLAGAWFSGLMSRFGKYTDRMQQVFGLVIIIAAVLIYTNYDKVFQLKLLNIFPSYGKFFSRIENNAGVSRQLRILRGGGQAQSRAVAKAEGLPELGIAPEFAGISQWLNTDEPLTMERLRGKIVLVNFWTYTCINCVRELPNVVDWYEKYKNSNFIVIGVHTPEFAFEKEAHNVLNAMKQFKINYPVALDNEYRTWRAYDNNYWPASYLVDVSGHIRKTHFGEGDYDEMEAAIRQLIEEAGNALTKTVTAVRGDIPRYSTPETYLGIGRMKRFVSEQPVTGGWQEFSLPAAVPRNYFGYGGRWNVSEESAAAGKGASLELRFNAVKVFLVISPEAKGGRIRVLLDGKPVDDLFAGADVKNGTLILDRQRLYNLIDLRGDLSTHLLRLEFIDDGISVYAFTFG
jgi:cytochrome c biogenesis protein CcdA/thiol-disulfide isomerase/thioredoxin